MKRLAKIWNVDERDGILHFSTCSTVRELLPIVAESDLNPNISDQWLALSARKDYTDEIVRQKPLHSDFQITDYIKLDETKTHKYRDDETVPVYMAWIEFRTGCLPVKRSLDNEIPEDWGEIINNQDYGVAEYGEHVDGSDCLLIESWDFFHSLAFNGYSCEALYKAMGIDEYSGFSDETISCSHCSKFDRRDNGYSYNHRYIEEVGDLGVNCGCYAEHCKNEYADNANDPEKTIELSTAQELETEGHLEFVERFIGGMLDAGRSGYFNGESCDQGDPKEVMKSYREKEPDTDFIFTHDESGQFQTYFSIWRLTGDQS